MIRRDELWSTKLNGDERLSFPSADFKPDGTLIAVGVGHRIHLYQVSNGVLVKQLKGHKDQIYSVSFSHDGKFLASGGADNCTIVWNEDGKGILKFSHAASVQVVLFNPVYHILASCSCKEFGFWTPNRRSVTKHHIDSKVLSAAWTFDGQLISLGHLSGKISFRNVNGEEVSFITRSAPIWALEWNNFSSVLSENGNRLAVGCWDRTISFYSITGDQIGKDHNIGYYPCVLSRFGSKGEYFLSGGSGKSVDLCNYEGTQLTQLHTDGHWIWLVKSSKNGKNFAIVTKEGILSIHSLVVEEVTDWYEDRVAYRESCTHVVIKQLFSQNKAKIKCHDLVRGLSLYSGRLAVQLSDRIAIYELPQNQGPYGMKYKLKFRLNIKAPSTTSILKLLSNNVIVCMDRIVALYNFVGVKQREWRFESSILCAKVLAGPTGHEGLIIGQESGNITIIYIDKKFSFESFHHSLPIVRLDVSCNCEYVAFIDDDRKCHVYEKSTKIIVHQSNVPVTNILFHKDINDLFCYYTSDTITIQKINDFTRVQGSCGGFPINFVGSRIFCINGDNLSSEDVAMTAIVIHQIEKSNYEYAYQLAMFGVSDSVWYQLGYKALLDLKIEVAMKSFRHIQNKTLYEFAASISRLPDNSYPSRDYISAEVAILNRKFDDARKFYLQTQNHQRAIDIFLKLKMFDYARSFVSDRNPQDDIIITRKEAEWKEQLNDWKGASDDYLAIYDYVKAISIIGSVKEEGWIGKLIDIVNRISCVDVEVAQLCTKFLLEEGMEEEAKKIYLKVGDYTTLMKLYISNKDWLEAAELCKDKEKHIDKETLLPYGNWLALQGRFSEAFGIYKNAGYLRDGQKLLKDLIENFLDQERYEEVSSLYFLLWCEFNSSVNNGIEQDETEMNSYSQLHLLFYVYNIIHSYFTEPFSCLDAQVIIQACVFLINSIANVPKGISTRKILWVFLKHARHLRLFQSIRMVQEQIQKFVLPPSWLDQLHIDMITIEATPKKDDIEHLPSCYRCGFCNPLLTNIEGKTNPLASTLDICIECKHPFIRCFVNFDILPLVEFKPDDSISEEEAIILLKEYSHLSVQNDTSSDINLFEEVINSGLHGYTDVYEPLSLDRNTLKSLCREEIFIQELSSDSNAKCLRRYYKNVIPDIGLALCRKCNQFFHEDAFEYEFLKSGGCPVCKHKILDSYGHL